MWNSVIQFYIREVWLIWGSNYITQCQKVSKELDNFKLFKKELKSLLLSHFFYSVDRFLQFLLKVDCKVFISASSD
jgi:hypothetical protein